MMDTSQRVFCTVVTRSHLRYAAALQRSLTKVHPEASFIVLIVDVMRGASLPEADFMNCSFLYFDDISSSALAEMAIYFDAYELCASCKPFLILHLLETLDIRQVFLLDSDLFLVNRLDLAVDLLDGAEFVCCPHMLTPQPDDGNNPQDLEIANAGVYNAGLLGFSNTPRSRNILGWMKKKVATHGFNWPERGMMCEQKFISLAALFFQDGFSPIYDPGYNLAYWNLHERELVCRDDEFFVGRHPVTFFHLSGFDIDQPNIFTRYSRRFVRSPGEPLDVMLGKFESLFADLPFKPWDGYGHATYDGIPLSRFLRRFYAFAKRLPTGDEAMKSGKHWYQLGRFGDAEQAFDFVSTIQSDRLDAIFGVGMCRLQLRRPAEAKGFFHRILQADPNHVGARRGLASVESSGPGAGHPNKPS